MFMVQELLCGKWSTIERLASYGAAVEYADRLARRGLRIRARYA